MKVKAGSTAWVILICLLVVDAVWAADPPPNVSADRPKVPGVLRLNLRERKVDPVDANRVAVVERTTDWKATETAIIVCDMWDDHHCKIAAQRVGAMAPRMNQVLTAARDGAS